MNWLFANATILFRKIRGKENRSSRTTAGMFLKLHMKIKTLKRGSV
jgi:hypothetical protein